MSSTDPEEHEAAPSAVADLAEPGAAASAESGPIRAGGSVAGRITAAAVGVAAFTLLAVGLLFFGFLGNYVIDRQKDQMRDHAVAVAGQLEADLPLSPLRGPGLRRLLTALLTADLQVLPQGAAINIFDDSGPVASAAYRRQSAAVVERIYQEGARLAEAGPGVEDLPASGGGQRIIVAAAPFDPVWGGEGLVVVSLPTSEARAAGRGLFRVLVISAVIALALAVVVGLALGSWLGRPIRRLSQAAGAMARGSYAEPVTGRYSGELYDLAVTMESMRREVRRSEQSLRGFVASAAHELRTPLTSIEGFSQALLDGTAASAEEQRRSSAAIYREAGRLRRLVDALLTLSRFDSREFRPNLVSFEAAALVGEEIGRLVEAGLAEPGRVSLVAEGDTTVRADPDMLRQVVANLLKNAVQYGGDEPVEARVGSTSSTLEIRVSNGGEVLSPEEGTRVFERFFRGRTHSRTEGFGLGLPLVREIMEVLGGTVELENGSRTTFLVRLPREPV